MKKIDNIKTQLTCDMSVHHLAKPIEYLKEEKELAKEIFKTTKKYGENKYKKGSLNSKEKTRTSKEILDKFISLKEHMFYLKNETKKCVKALQNKITGNSQQGIKEFENEIEDLKRYIQNCLDSIKDASENLEDFTKEDKNKLLKSLSEFVVKKNKLENYFKTLSTLNDSMRVYEFRDKSNNVYNIKARNLLEGKEIYRQISKMNSQNEQIEIKENVINDKFIDRPISSITEDGHKTTSILNKNDSETNNLDSEIIDKEIDYYTYKGKVYSHNLKNDTISEVKTKDVK